MRHWPTGYLVGKRFTVADVNVAEVVRYAQAAPELFEAAPTREGVACGVPGTSGVQGDVGEAGRRAGVTAKRKRAYFIAPKRLSKELPETIGCAPDIEPLAAAVGCCAGCCAGLACAVAAGFGSADPSARRRAGAGFGGVLFASITRGLAGGALAVVSDLPMPILRARLEKKPSDFAGRISRSDACRRRRVRAVEARRQRQARAHAAD